MTLKEFDNSKFIERTYCIYKEKEYHVILVDFEERLIAINTSFIYDDDFDKLNWKRCENITLIKT